MTGPKVLAAREVGLYYFWFEVTALCIAVGIVVVTIPFIAVLLLANGDVFAVGWQKVAVAALVVFPFTIPVAALVSRWVFGIAAQVYPRPEPSRLKFWRRKDRLELTADEVAALRVPPGARSSSPPWEG